MNKLLNNILFYGLLIPLSLLPVKILYFVFGFMPFFLHSVVKYRKNVVVSNLRKSFPYFTEQQIKDITKKYYSHLSDILLESLKMLTISKKGVMKRYKCLNPSILNPYLKQNKSVILVSAHYNNWEYLVLSLSMQFQHHGIGVGKSMSNKTFETLMHKKRTRYGTEVVYAENVRETFKFYEQENKPCAYMMLFDQSPNNDKRCYITTFLSQKTAVIYGQEYFAKKYNFPVFFYKVRKVKRGYYEFELEHITDTPNETEYGFITEKSLSVLTSLINEAPQYWLWSHRRWKIHLE
jgi:KDO2-lipid IV(A) lauroyltransferase